MGRAAAVVIKEIEDLLDELAVSVAEPMPGSAATEAVVGLGTVRNRVDAAFVKAVGYVDSTHAHVHDDARTTAV